VITTIIFDLSEVYLQGIVGSHGKLEKILGFQVDPEYFYNEAFDHFMLGQITEETYLKTVIDRHGWDIAVDILKTAVRKNFIEIHGTRKIIEQLKQKGYTLVLLSNQGKEWGEYCESQYAYHTLFDHVVYSYEVHLAKPSKDIFTHVLTTLKLNPEECLFIDDNIKNITAARHLKITALQFTNSEELKASLRKFNISL